MHRSDLLFHAALLTSMLPLRHHLPITANRRLSFTFQRDIYWMCKTEDSIDKFPNKYSGRFIPCHVQDIDGDFEEMEQDYEG